MDFGVSVFLIAVGAILTFAVKATVSGLDIATVGVILMLAGALGLAWSFYLYGSRRRPAVYTAPPRAPVVRSAVYERDVVDEPLADDTVAYDAPVPPRRAVRRRVVRDEYR